MQGLAALQQLGNKWLGCFGFGEQIRSILSLLEL